MDKPISQLDLANPLSGTEVFPLVQTGLTKQTPISSVLNWLLGEVDSVNIYNTDGTLEGNRVVNGDGNSLDFTSVFLGIGGSNDNQSGTTLKVYSQDENYAASFYNANGSVKILSVNEAIDDFVNGVAINLLGKAEANLHVGGTLRFVTGNQALGRVLTSDTDGNADWVDVDASNIYFSDGTLTANRTVYCDDKDLNFENANIKMGADSLPIANATLSIGCQVDAHGLVIGNSGGGQPFFFATDGSEVSIGNGVELGTATLSVKGSLRFVTGAEGAGKVLTSDADGYANWQTPSGGGLSGGTLNYLARWTGATSLGIGVTRDDGTTVGIGIAPSANMLTIAKNSSGLVKLLEVQNLSTNNSAISAINVASNQSGLLIGATGATVVPPVGTEYGTGGDVFIYRDITTPNKNINYINESGKHIFFSNTDAGNSTPPLVVSGENIGVGTVNPSGRVHVVSASTTLVTAFRGDNSTSGTLSAIRATLNNGLTQVEIGVVGQGSTGYANTRGNALDSFVLHKGNFGNLNIVTETGAVSGKIQFYATIQVDEEPTMNLDGRKVNIGTSSLDARFNLKGEASNAVTWAMRINNSTNNPLLRVRNDGVVLMENLPTSPLGLPSGSLWNNSGVINIV